MRDTDFFRASRDDPEYYLAGPNSGVTVEATKNRPPFSSPQAVRQDRVFVTNEDLVNRSGQRIAEGFGEIAETIHPEVFAGGAMTGVK